MGGIVRALRQGGRVRRIHGTGRSRPAAPGSRPFRRLEGMSGYLLDTNIASHVIRGDRLEISQRLASLPREEIAISAVTEGELLYGLAKRNYPTMLTERVRQFLLRVDVLGWD